MRNKKRSATIEENFKRFPTRVFNLHLSSGFAQGKKLPVSIVGRITKETRLAFYVYGEGTLNGRGFCCICGKALSNPEVILSGVSSVCADRFNIPVRYLDKPRLTPAELDHIRSIVKGIKINGWIPKAAVIGMVETNEIVNLPKTRQSSSPLDSSEKRATKFVDLVRGKLKITFPYNPPLIARVKGLSGREFDKKDRSWFAPYTLDSISRLKEWGFVFSTVLEARVQKIKSVPGVLITYDDLVKLGFSGDNRAYQIKGINMIEKWGGRALLADPMGLGKTVQALGWVIYRRRKIKQTFVLAPANAKYVWKKIGEAVTDFKIQVVNGKPDDPDDDFFWGDVVCINYDIVANRQEWAIHKVGKNKGKKKLNAKDKPYKVDIPYTGWVDYIIDAFPKKGGCLITDEAHYLNNDQALRTKAFNKICKLAQFFIPISGTAIKNRPKELFTVLKALRPEIFNSYWNYARRYCGAKHNGFGWNFDGASNTKELHELLSSCCMIRRKKNSVLKDLPPKQRIVVPVKCSLGRYKREEAEFIKWLKHNGDDTAAALQKITFLKKAAVQSKMEGVFEWVDCYLANESKLVLFCHHKETVNALMERYSDIAIKIDGSVTGEKRSEAETRFQTDDSIKLFVGTKAAKEALTLTAAAATCTIEFWWTPGDHDQAEDRVHRDDDLTRKNARVFAYYLIAEDTIEEDLAKLIDTKRIVTSGILDGEDVVDTDLLTQLIGIYNKR